MYELVWIFISVMLDQVFPFLLSCDNSKIGPRFFFTCYNDADDCYNRTTQQDNLFEADFNQTRIISHGSNIGIPRRFTSSRPGGVLLVGDLYGVVKLYTQRTNISHVVYKNQFREMYDPDNDNMLRFNGNIRCLPRQLFRLSRRNNSEVFILNCQVIVKSKITGNFEKIGDGPSEIKGRLIVGLSAAIVNGMLCLFGFHFALHAKCFNSSSMKWFDNPAIPGVNRLGHQTIATNDIIYHCGGVKVSNWTIVNDNPHSCEWHSIGQKKVIQPDFNFPFDHYQHYELFIQDGRVFAVGVVEDRIELFDVKLGKTTVSIPRAGYQFQTVGIVFACPEDQPEITTSTVTPSDESFVNLAEKTQSVNSTTSSSATALVTTRSNIPTFPWKKSRSYAAPTKQSLRTTRRVPKLLLKLYINKSVAKSEHLRSDSKNILKEICDDVLSSTGCPKCRVEVLRLKKSYIPIKITELLEVRIKRSVLEDIDDALMTFFERNTQKLYLEPSGDDVTIIGNRLKADTNQNDGDNHTSETVTIVVVVCVAAIISTVLVLLFLAWSKRLPKNGQLKTEETSNPSALGTAKLGSQEISDGKTTNEPGKKIAIISGDDLTTGHNDISLVKQQHQLEPRAAQSNEYVSVQFCPTNPIKHSPDGPKSVTLRTGDYTLSSNKEHEKSSKLQLTSESTDTVETGKLRNLIDKQRNTIEPTVNMKVGELSPWSESPEMQTDELVQTIGSSEEP